MISEHDHTVYPQLQGNLPPLFEASFPPSIGYADSNARPQLDVEVLCIIQIFEVSKIVPSEIGTYPRDHGTFDEGLGKHPLPQWPCASSVSAHLPPFRGILSSYPPMHESTILRISLGHCQPLEPHGTRQLGSSSSSLFSRELGWRTAGLITV